MDDKLSKLEKIIEVLDKDTVTQEDFVYAFEQLLTFVQNLKDSNDSHMLEIDAKVDDALDKGLVKLATYYGSEWTKIKEKVDSLRNGNDYVLTEADKQEIASLITVPVVERIIQKTEVTKEQPIIREVSMKDTADEIVSKVNESTKLIDAERVGGFKELETQVRANALPPTTTHFSRDGVPFGRAKNVNMVGSMVQVIQDQAYITPVVVSLTAPSNPFLNQLWLDIN